MAFSYHLAPEHACVLIRLHGSVDGRDITDALERSMLDRAFRPAYVMLIDGSDIDELILVPDDVQHFTRVLRILQPLAGESRTAIVARRDLVHMAASLYAEHAMDVLLEHEIGVFRRLADARKWLGLPRDAPLSADIHSQGEPGAALNKKERRAGTRPARR